MHWRFPLRIAPQIGSTPYWRDVAFLRKTRRRTALTHSLRDGLNDQLRRYVIQIPRRRGDAGVAKLLGNDAYVYALFTQLRRMCVPQPMRMHSLLDAGSATEAGKKSSDVPIAKMLVRSTTEDRWPPLTAHAINDGQ